MAEIVNPQITDAVTQTNVNVVGEAPAMAMGSLYQTIGNSVAMAAANAVYAQQQSNITYQAATTMAVKTLLGSNNQVSATDFSTAANAMSEGQIEEQIADLEERLKKMRQSQQSGKKEK